MNRAAVFFLMGAALACPAIAQWQNEVVLKGANVVPPVATSAFAVGVFTLNEPSHSVNYFLIVAGLSATAVRVRLGAAGQNGPILFTLAGGPVIFEGQIPPLSQADVVTMLKQGWHAVVETAAFPSGEIRGQLQPTKKSSFNATLNGAKCVPPTASAALGFSSNRLNEPDGVIVYDLKTLGASASATASARLGSASQNSPVLFPLVGGSGHWCGVSPFLSDSDIAAIKAGGLYFQVDSPGFPNGEIRGQLAGANVLFSTHLDGAQEVPASGSTASGCGRFELDVVTSMLSFTIGAGGLTGPPTAAHIHRGVLGEAGPILVPIAGGPATWTGVVGPLAAADVDALYRGTLYFDVRTAAFPLGEIRGQIRPDPYVFGVGIGTNGPLKITATGYAPPAWNYVTVGLAGALANVDSFLFISASSSFSSVLNAFLPAPILFAGLLYTDANPGFVIQAPNGVAGCPEVAFQVPTDPALACFRGYAQWVTIDFSNPFNFVLSDALELTIVP